MEPPEKRRKVAKAPAKKRRTEPVRVRNRTRQTPVKKQISAESEKEPKDAPRVPVRRNPKRGAALKEPTSKPLVPWLGRGLSVSQDLSDSNQTQSLMELPTPPSNVAAKDWPHIWYGDDAPTPRWLVTLDGTDPATGKDLALDAIKIRLDQTIIKGVSPHDHPRSYDSSLGLGGLIWGFDPGPEKDWCGLNEAQLYELAYRSLEEALNDPTCREQFRIAIRGGKYQEAIANVEDPLPPLPPTPETHLLTPGSYLKFIKDRETKIGAPSYYFPRNTERPRMAVLTAVQSPIVKQMSLHRKGTMGPPGEISISYSPLGSEVVARKPELRKEPIAGNKTADIGK